jgi:hypothetical protein
MKSIEAIEEAMKNIKYILNKENFEMTNYTEFNLESILYVLYMSGYDDNTYDKE